LGEPESVTLPANLGEWQRRLLTDPQTSGGLLIACDRSRAAEIIKLIADKGYPHARISGMRFRVDRPHVADV
jgi:selenide, water dikinase